MKIEKLFFSITRWITLIAATLAFLAVIGGVFYAVHLYKTSKDTEIDRKTYTMKSPDVSFDEVMNIEGEERRRILNIKTYVYGVIKNGSKDHGYAMGNMEGGMAAGDDAEKISIFVANKLEGDYPKSFGICAGCHGPDGLGMDGASPNLKELPIYNGLRAKVSNAKKVLKAIEDTTTESKTEKTPREKAIDHITANINRYAIKVDQEGISRADMEGTINAVTGGYSDRTVDIYIEQLVDATDNLLVYGQNYKKENNQIVGPVEWRKFLTIFTTEFDSFMREEQEKSQKMEAEQDALLLNKQMEAQSANIQLLIVINAIGIALGSFLLLTMILVLLKIEKNTRKEENAPPNNQQSEGSNDD